MTEGERVSPGRRPARRRHEVAPEAGAFFCPSPSGAKEGGRVRAILTASPSRIRHVPGFDPGGGRYNYGEAARQPGIARRQLRRAAGRHNIREQDTPDHMAFLAERMAGKCLSYRELIR